jgi:hypothetical protein
MAMRKVLVLSLLGMTLFGAGVVYGRQPYMQAALESLRDARSQLEQASHDKGGHRARAIDLINRAIDEVREGMRYDHRH